MYYIYVLLYLIICCVVFFLLFLPNQIFSILYEIQPDNTEPFVNYKFVLNPFRKKMKHLLDLFHL